MSRLRRRRDEAVLTAPVTVEYVRQSHRSAHWFVTRTLAGLLDASGLRKEDIDGLCLASFGLAPDTAIGMTQYDSRSSPRRSKHIGRCQFRRSCVKH